MASTRVQTPLAWTAAAFVSLNTNNLVWSDEVLFNAGDRDVAQLQVHCDNSGTPASGDVVTVFIAWTFGDITGAGGGANQYDTDEHAQRLGRIDTFATNTPGEDPARRTFDIPALAKGFKLGLQAAQGATRAITARAMLGTIRDA